MSWNCSIWWHHFVDWSISGHIDIFAPIQSHACVSSLRVLIRKQAHSEPAPDRVLTAYQHYAIIQTTLKEDWKNEQATNFRQIFHISICALVLSSICSKSLFFMFQMQLTQHENRGIYPLHIVWSYSLMFCITPTNHPLTFLSFTFFFFIERISRRHRGVIVCAACGDDKEHENRWFLIQKNLINLL